MSQSARAKQHEHFFTVSHASGDHWGAAAKACLDGLGPYRGKGANMGFLYATEAFAEDLGSILTFLRETTPIETWVGGIVPGLCAQSTEYRSDGAMEGGALGIMVGTLPPGSFTPFTASDFSTHLRHDTQAAILHGDPRHPLVVTLTQDLGEAVSKSVGGLVSSIGPEQQLSGALTSFGASGVLLGPGTGLVVGLTQGCSPIGTTHIITQCQHNLILELDGLPALDVLKADAGDLIARNLKMAAGYIHVGFHESEGYTVRSLIGIDPARKLFAVGAPTLEGQKMMFVKRDANTAQADLALMLDRVKNDLNGLSPLGALYFSCIARGKYMFGEEGAEMAQIRNSLDNIPLLGFFANGEIANGHIYGYTGVLAVLVQS